MLKTSLFDDTKIMEPGHYILLNAIVVILLVMSIFYIKKGGIPKARLNLGKKTEHGLVVPGPEMEFSEDGGEMRALNVVFQHKGEWYDAYEVLELPAGASGVIIKNQYDKLKRGADVTRQEILALALDSLRSRI